VIDGRKRPMRRANRPPPGAQHVKRLRARHFVNEMQADVELGLTRGQSPHGVLIPDLLKKRLRHQ